VEHILSALPAATVETKMPILSSNSAVTSQETGPPFHLRLPSKVKLAHARLRLANYVEPSTHFMFIFNWLMRSSYKKATMFLLENMPLLTAETIMLSVKAKLPLAIQKRWETVVAGNVSSIRIQSDANVFPHAHLIPERLQ